MMNRAKFRACTFNSFEGVVTNKQRPPWRVTIVVYSININHIALKAKYFLQYVLPYVSVYQYISVAYDI